MATARTYRYGKDVYTLGTDWVEITASLRGDYFAIRNRGPARVQMTTDVPDVDGNVGNIDTIEDGTQDGLIVPRSVGSQVRFAKGDTVFYLRSEAGGATVTVTWIL